MFQRGKLCHKCSVFVATLIIDPRAKTGFTGPLLLCKAVYPIRLIAEISLLTLNQFTYKSGP